jgi:hypothetical protein
MSSSVWAKVARDLGVMPQLLPRPDVMHVFKEAKVVVTVAGSDAEQLSCVTRALAVAAVVVVMVVVVVVVVVVGWWW